MSLRQNPESSTATRAGRWMRWRKSVASIGAVAMIAALFGAIAPATATAAPSATDSALQNVAAGDPVRWVFDYTGSTQEFVVPAGVTELTMLVTGGAGANPNEDVAAGAMSGLVLTRQKVTEGDTLTIWVAEGGVGGGGWGWGCGGDHGHAPHSIGWDGGGGGGASAVSVGAFSDGSDCTNRPDNSTLLAVGGGGAGGGGDGYVLNEGFKTVFAFGGAGGAAGYPAEKGDSPSEPVPDWSYPDPGCGGCLGSPNGGAGGNAGAFIFGGAGGGGGGGYQGGGGGGGESEIAGGAGAGGGGGLSYAKATGTETSFLTGDAVGNGQVILSLEPEVAFSGCSINETDFTSPAGMPLVHVHAEGAQGGISRDAQGGRGGYGGTVDGDVRITASHPEFSMDIGCSGLNGGAGYGDGGDHGATDGYGYTGGTGGGGTAVAIHERAMLTIAGGGGGGGGDASGDGKGGDGGDGGDPPGNGGEGKTGTDDGDPADGGSGGCQTDGHGGPGDGLVDDPFTQGGGGGGGGGGLHGGCGGEAGGAYNPGSRGDVGGGGGGAGESWAGADLRNVQYGTTARAGDGAVFLTLGTMAISSTGGSKQRAEINQDFASELTATVTDAAGNPIDDVAVEFNVTGGGAGTPSGVFGAWQNAVQTKTVTTDAAGIAHSGVVTAGINPGNWTAIASLVDFDVDDSAHFQLTNQGAPSTTVASVDPKPALVGAPIEFVAAVTTGARSAHRTVDFWIDGTKRYTEPLKYSGDGYGDDSVATATYTPATDPGGFVLEPGEHTVVAVYHGDEAFAGSADTKTFSVVDAQSTTTITSSKNPSDSFENVTFDVTTTVPAGEEPLAGYSVEITYASGAGTTVQHGVLDENGEYEVTRYFLQNTEVTAQVSGDGPVAGSSDALIQYVVGDGNLVALSVTSSPNPAAPGQPVEFASILTPPEGGATPTGTVTYTNGSTELCRADVALSEASCTGANPSMMGAHRIVATYSGDANYQESYGIVYQQTIPGATETTVTAAPDSSSVFGQPVSFTARVALATGNTGAGEVSGTVLFTLDGQPFGDPVTVAADGTATSAAISSLAVGGHHVVATYGGSAALLSSTGSLDHEVAPAQTTVDLAASAEPSTAGQPVSFTATVAPVAPGAGVPEGTVQFQVDGDDFGAPVTVDAGTALSSSVDTLAIGDHAVGAVFTPTGDSFTGSDARIAHSVVSSSHLHLTSSANPARYGDAVAFTANLTPSTNDGTVSFTIDGVAAGGCDAVAVSDGVAECAAPLLDASVHTVDATYSGSTDLAPSAAQITQTVTQATTATEVTSSSNPSIPGQEVRFTATVTTDAGEPMTGTVQFVVDGFAVGVPVAVDDGHAISAGVTDLDLGGAHSVVATYSGDQNFSASAGTLTQWVGGDSTVTALSSSDNPSVYGDAVTFTATVTAEALTPEGSMQFEVDGEPFGDLVPVVDGSATSAATDALSAGSHAITAEFFGDATFAGSHGSMTQTISPAASSTQVESSVNPSTFGQAVTFTASVSGNGPAAPTGVVQFSVDGMNVGLPAALVDGDAESAPVSGLSVGEHDVTATYLGDINYFGSSEGLLQRMTIADSTVTVTSSTNPAQAGQPVQFTAAVAAVAPGVGVPGGQVQFLVDGDAFGAPVTVSDGTATSADNTGLTPGDHTITAEYLGDGGFAPSEGTLTQRIFASPSTTSVDSSLNPSAFGQSVTFTATVVGDGTEAPTGEVQFQIDGQPFGASVTLQGGQAVSDAVDDLPAGQHTITAAYAGTTQDGPSSGDLVQSVDQAATVTTVGSSANPSAFGQTVTFTAVVSMEGAGVPTGVVQFSVDGMPVGLPAALVGGEASAEPVSGLALGEHDVVATYFGDVDFSGSTGTLQQVVSPADTVTTLSSSHNPATLGDPLTFTATVTDAAVAAARAGAAVAAAASPAGQVQFSVDGEPIGGPVTVVDGIAVSRAISDLTVGEHTIAADFSGDGYAASRGELTQRITAVTPPTPPTPPGPPGPPVPPHGHGDLPNTGSDASLFAALAALLLLFGGTASVVAYRRRRRDPHFEEQA